MSSAEGELEVMTEGLNNKNNRRDVSHRLQSIVELACFRNMSKCSFGLGEILAVDHKYKGCSVAHTLQTTKRTTLLHNAKS